MLSTTILLIELSLLALAILMVQRVFKLYHAYSLEADTQSRINTGTFERTDACHDEAITIASEAGAMRKEPSALGKEPSALGKEQSALEKGSSALKDSSSSYEAHMYTLKQAQVFCANQLLDASRKQMLPNLWHTRAEHGLTPELPEWLNEAISLYLIGAVDFIGQQKQNPNKQRKRLIITTLKSQLHIDNDRAETLFLQALKRQSGSEHEEMVRVGASAAKSWLQNQNVPDTYKLSSQLQNWGVFV